MTHPKTTHPHISRPLQSTPLLFADNRRPSQKAIKVLRAAGIEPEIIKISVVPNEPEPVLLHLGGIHRGIRSIEGWVRLILLRAAYIPNSSLFVPSP